MCSARPKTAKITRLLLFCCLNTSKTVSKSYFQYPGVVIHSRNHFTAVPQASTFRQSSDLWAFFTLFPNFRTFFTGSSQLFHLKQPRELLPVIFRSFLKVRGYFCYHSGKASSGLRSTLAPTKENTQKHEKLPFLQ